MFSALKHEGRPLYEYARKGIVIERKPRDICIHAIDIEAFAPPLARIAVRCSKGTYIRTLSEDIAKHIGTFAHLTALRRTATAGFSIGQSHTLEALAEMSAAERDAVLLPCDVLVQAAVKQGSPSVFIPRNTIGSDWRITVPTRAASTPSV